jgi:hypothetical protein
MLFVDPQEIVMASQTASRVVCLVVAAAIGMAVLPAAADAVGPIVLKASAPVAPDIAAFPRIAGGASKQAAAPINRALATAENGLGCEDDKGSWSRNVTVTMRGPRYLGLLAQDDWYCGGAYPDTNTTALVYDVAAGTAIDWRRLFGAGVVAAATTSPGGGDAAPITVSSPALWVAYAKAVAADATDRNPECREVLADQRDSGLMLWPDAAADGLGVQAADFPHVIKACGPAESLSRPELRKLGAAAAFLAAIDAAHRHGWYDRAKK